MFGREPQRSSGTGRVLLVSELLMLDKKRRSFDHYTIEGKACRENEQSKLDFARFANHFSHFFWFMISLFLDFLTNSGQLDRG